jgi:hypothetical protein
MVRHEAQIVTARALRHAGASRRATCARVGQVPVGHAICGVLSAPGPAFQWPPAIRDLPLSQLLAGAPSGPGGGSGATRRPPCDKRPAGAAPRPAIKTPLERTPRTDEVTGSNCKSKRG